MANGESRSDEDKSPLSSPYARRAQNPNGAGANPPTIYDQFGRVLPPPNDPAYPRPRDPLEGIDPRASASVIFREIPLAVVQTSWTVPAVRSALSALVAGLFDTPAQLWDSISGDDRVQATLGSRTGGLLGRPLRHRPAQLARVKGSRAAKECHEAWVEAWPKFATEAALSEMLRWGIGLGWGFSQLLWDTTEEIWVPKLDVWHPRYTYYHWTLRCFVAVTMDGQLPIVPGDGHWVLHAPNGAYRGWMRGAMRALAQPWLIRALAYRDWARYSERHGMPIFKAMTPAAGDPRRVSQFRLALQTLGQENVIQLPQGNDKEFSYDLDMLEAASTNWQAFAELIDRCEKSMTLAVQFQNLTTEVKEGSLAAARVHADVRQSALEADERGLMLGTVHQQIARPFAAFNFGDPDLAPVSRFDVRPEEDKAMAAKTLADFSNAILALGRAGWEVDDLEEFARQFGIRRMSPKKTKPLGSGFGQG